ncbi:MAG TPA: hypothetical protein VMF07_03880 [Solirubrobacteraceae bacterium]|nr:hypothetical protein [Solirubrobacteraceae bacterium]
MTSSTLPLPGALRRLSGASDAPRGADAVRTARRCAIAGATFAALLCAALLLLDHIPSLGAPTLDYLRFYLDGAGTLVTIGVYLVPLAGVAFLWFMFTLREALGRRDDDATVSGLQCATGVAFLCLLFAGAAAVASDAFLRHRTGLLPLHMEAIRAHTSLGYTLVFLYAVRMAGAFMIATTTMATRRGLIPMWLSVAGYVAAVVLLIAASNNPAILILMPAWTVAISLAIWADARRTASLTPSTAESETDR